MSPTELNFTFISPPNAVASYYEMNFKGGAYYTHCNAPTYFGPPPYVCLYKDLKPGTKYEFQYYAGRIAWGLDITTPLQYISASTPPDRKCYLCSHEALGLFNYVCWPKRHCKISTRYIYCIFSFTFRLGSTNCDERCGCRCVFHLSGTIKGAELSGVYRHPH